jgi:hypothetical protein
VTVASVKNFQLVALMEVLPTTSQSDHDKVLLQCGKIGKFPTPVSHQGSLKAKGAEFAREAP